MKTLKVISLLLSYPGKDIQKTVPELKTVLAGEGALDKPCLESLYALMDELSGKDLLDVQANYVNLFDRTRSLSLHLFEHVHGESRDRGQAMVDLLALYEKNGLYFETRELPDYLPVFIEFLSTLPARQARGLLSEPLHILTVLKQRLEKRQSPYAALFQALEHIAGAKPGKGKVEAMLDQNPDDDPDDMQAIDEAWEEKEVRFGPDAPGGECPKMQDLLKEMGPPGDQGTRGGK